MEDRPFSDISFESFLNEEKLMGSRCSQCQELYGKGVYQELISWLAPGSLEQLIDTLTTRVANLLKPSGD